MNILYLVINGEITGGNIICLRIIEEALRSSHRVIVNSPTEGKFTSILREKNIRVYNIDTRRSFRFSSAIKLARIIKKEGINLVHSHTPLGGIVLSRLAGWITKAPVVNHAHLRETFNPNSFIKQSQFLLNWITSRYFCAKVIAVSEIVKREIIKQGTCADKISIVYNGIDVEDRDYNQSNIKIREEFGLEQNQRIVGEVGRLCSSKGQHILIEAAARVLRKISDVVFMIVGEDLEEKGEYRNKLVKLASDLGLRKEIIFTGYRPDIMDLMNTFDLFVLPTAIEGLSIVTLEAMAAKKPVITTSIEDNAGVVINEETGTVVPSNDPDKLAEAIIYHLQNPQISKKMGEKGYERLRQKFSLSRMLSEVMDIYKEILN